MFRCFSKSQCGSYAPPNTATNYQDYTATFTTSTTSSLLAFSGTNLNGGDNTVFIDNLVITATSNSDDPFSDWMTTHYPDLEAPDNEPTADPDNDGINNFTEYAFGLQPDNGSSRNPITTPLRQNIGEFSYTRRVPAIAGLSFVVEATADLIKWEIDETATQSITSTEGDVETVSVLLSPSLITEPKLFVRIRALPLNN